MAAPLFIALAVSFLALGLMAFVSALLAKLTPGPALQSAAELHQQAAAALQSVQVELPDFEKDETAAG